MKAKKQRRSNRKIVKFTKDYVNNKKGDLMKVDGAIYNHLVNDKKVAVLESEAPVYKKAAKKAPKKVAPKKAAKKAVKKKK